LKRRKITFLLPSIAGFYTKDVIEEEIKIFRRKKPDISVEVHILSWTKLWSMLVDIMKRRKTIPSPDIIAIGNTWLGTALYFELLIDISKFTSFFSEKVFLPKLVKNKIVLKYSVPWISDIRVLYYRKDILQKINVDESEIKTIDGFVKSCEKIKKEIKDIYPFAISGQKEEILIHDLFPWLYIAGNFYRRVGNKIRFFSEKVYEGMRFYFALVRDYYIPYRLKLKVAPPGNFFTGDYAFQVSGTYPKKSIFNKKHSEYRENVAKNFGVSFLPSTNGKTPVTYIGGINLVVPYTAKDVSSSLEFIKFLISPESQLRCVSSLSMLPARVDCFEKFFTENEGEIKKVFLESSKKGKTLSCVPLLGTIEKMVSYFTTSIFRLMLERKYNEEILRKKVIQLIEEIDFIERW